VKKTVASQKARQVEWELDPKGPAECAADMRAFSHSASPLTYPTAAVRLNGLLLAVSLTAGLLQAVPPATAPVPAALWQQVEVIRTAHGVPHIRAGNLRARRALAVRRARPARR
jgi:hypothetical protein